jgi:tetratricopeptide (TPR) repeat protein
MRAAAFLLLVSTAAAGLLAQAPVRLDEAFFSGDRARVVREITNRARSMNDGDAKLLAEYGRAYLAALDVQKGKEALRLAEAKEPNDGEVLRMIALAWLKNGFKAEALGAYEQILRRDPKNTDSIGRSAVDLAEVGLVKEAEKYMGAFVAREPEDWRTFLAFGRAFLTGGFRQQAAPWFARAVALKPENEEVMVEILRAFTDTQSVM